MKLKLVIVDDMGVVHVVVVTDDDGEDFVRLLLPDCDIYCEMLGRLWAKVKPLLYQGRNSGFLILGF